MSPATIQSTYVFMCIARFVPECNQSGISRQIFVEFSNIKFHGTLIITSRTDTCRLSDGLTDMIKLIRERTYKLYIVVPTVALVPSTIGKLAQNH